MKKQLLLFTMFCLWSTFSFAQIVNVGVIGTATPGEWADDTDMVQDDIDTAKWSLDIALVAGEIKFRANDDWAINWGATDFPVGTAVLDNSDNITVPAGQFTILFNSVTGDYEFIEDIPEFTSVGVIGTATPGEWTDDTDMVQDPDDADLWTLDITLTTGEIKFRADDDWAINWGATAFPTGTAELNNSNNIFAFAGDYTISFNSATGDYNFDVHSAVGIIGEATPGGWIDDTDMIKDSTEHGWFITLDLTNSECKFRADDDWATNWGASDFPTGTAILGDPGNIPVSKAGEYRVTFDSLSGDYTFTEIVEYNSIGIIGSATPGGWDDDTDMVQNPDNASEWTLDIELVEGEAKFRANDAWDFDWGGPDFPSGIAVPKSSDNFPVTAGNYRVTFNVTTLEYSFLILADYDVISILGTATSGGWDVDSDMTQDVDNDELWKGSFALTDGLAKFRANHDWAVANWGSGDFPTGVGTIDGSEIPVVAGEYNVTFNTLTGEYSFELFVVYDQVSIVGDAGPFGQWPDDTGDYDTYLTVDDDDDQLWTASLVVLAEADTMNDGGIKFRANTDWSVNWGSRDFPIGVGTQDGKNIWCLAGTYNVSFNSLTGDYVFSDPNATQEILKPTDIQLFPNPASQTVNIDLSSISLKGDLNVSVYDMSGNLVSTQSKYSENIISIDVKSLDNGMYFVHIANEKYMIGKRFTIIK